MLESQLGNNWNGAKPADRANFIPCLQPVPCSCEEVGFFLHWRGKLGFVSAAFRVCNIFSVSTYFIFFFFSKLTQFPCNLYSSVVSFHSPHLHLPWISVLASLVDYLVKDLHIGCIYYVQAQQAFLLGVLKALLKATLLSVERILLPLGQALVSKMHRCVHVFTCDLRINTKSSIIWFLTLQRMDAFLVGWRKQLRIGTLLFFWVF